jgi:RNA polymerase sigma-70 factor, ECF subfamily
MTPQGVFQTPMTDELAARLATNLDASFEELVRTFQDRLYAFALRLTNSPQDAEEATQDTFVRAYRALQRYPSERVSSLRLRPWLYQIELNVVRNQVRRPAPKQVDIDGPPGDSLESTTADEQPEAAMANTELRAQLTEVLTALPDRYRTAVVLRHVQGLSYAEAADVLGQPLGTTKSDVHRGLRLIRQALAPRSVSAPLLVGDYS